MDELTQTKQRWHRHKKVAGWVISLCFFVLIVLVWLRWGGPLLLSTVSFQYNQQTLPKNDVPYYQNLQASIQRLSNTLRLPETIQVEVKDCEESNAFYEPDDRAVIVCTELMNDFRETFRRVYDDEKDVTEASANALIFITYHELGHALIDILEIPITGKEEDVADQFATYMLMRTHENGAQIILDGATWFGITSEQYELEESDFSGEHSLDAQRYYTLACWVYGSNPAVYQAIVIDGGLPEDRLDLCREEYTLFMQSWTHLLRTYIN